MGGDVELIFKMCQNSHNAVTNFQVITAFFFLCVCKIPQVISYDSTRGGISVITEKGDVTTSYLLIQDAELTDSGKYSCSPSNADVASVRVHVLNGKLASGMWCLTSEHLRISRMLFPGHQNITHWSLFDNKKYHAENLINKLNDLTYYNHVSYNLSDKLS